VTASVYFHRYFMVNDFQGTDFKVGGSLILGYLLASALSVASQTVALSLAHKKLIRPGTDARLCRRFPCS
jgi:hypothetical protein